MNQRIRQLRKESFESKPAISSERALLITKFYKENDGKYSTPVMRAMAFKHLCENKKIYIGENELIVGERGPGPKQVPTYPELTCHTVEDLRVLNLRDKVSYRTDESTIDDYEKSVIPYWKDRTMRERIFSNVPPEWNAAYESGVFTEFMEQRAPGHTTLDGKIYRKGLKDFKEEIAATIKRLDFLNDPRATDRREQLIAMDISCDAAVIFARRHAEEAENSAANLQDSARKKELLQIAANCRNVPENRPKTFWEALQMYWFIHLGTITELNGWDAMNPGHLDQHLYPFYKMELEQGTLTKDTARELLECLWIKFNNHPAPPKVGVTAAESGTYNDFTNINLGGLKRDGSDGVNDLSYLLLEVINEMHLLQPGSNIQVSRKTPDRFLKAACRVIRNGYGYPSVFNTDAVIAEQIRSGKIVEDAREGGTSGCIETGCFGKEAYILTGYLNVPKIFEITLFNGRDPLCDQRIGIETGDPQDFHDFEQFYQAFEAQLKFFIDLKVQVNQYVERMFAKDMPAPFLSVFIEDCIQKGKDYYNGGPRYNTTYIQCCGIGTVTDSLSAIKTHIYDTGKLSWPDLLESLVQNFQNREDLRLMLANKTPRFGNDHDGADALMQRVYESLFKTIDGRSNTKGGVYHLNMLSTTCHVYFGTKLGATPDGRFAGFPESDGTSPSQGADRNGPTAVCQSLGKMDQIKSGGTLLNVRFLPHVLAGEEGIDSLVHLIRGYFRLDGHHIQFNVVDSDTLRDAQKNPDLYRDLLVRVAGYSDYFCDLTPGLQEEIISRTAQSSF